MLLNCPVGCDNAVYSLIKNTQELLAVNLMRHFFGRRHKKSGYFLIFFPKQVWKNEIIRFSQLLEAFADVYIRIFVLKVLQQDPV